MAELDNSFILRERKKCKWFGHDWVEVIINRPKQFKFIACYCQRCMLGHDELIKFVEANQPIINSYNFKFWTNP
jgi:hypothetical protein